MSAKKRRTKGSCSGASQRIANIKKPVIRYVGLSQFVVIYFKNSLYFKLSWRRYWKENEFENQSIGGNVLRINDVNAFWRKRLHLHPRRFQISGLLKW